MNHELTYDGAFYAEVGNFIKENYLEYIFTKGTVQEVDFLIEALGLGKGAKIFDVGCGAGRHSLELARRGFETLGIDISSGLIEVAAKVAAKENLRATFQVQDARSPKFSNEFDAAICLCEGAFGLAGDEQGHRRILKDVPSTQPTIPWPFETWVPRTPESPMLLPEGYFFALAGEDIVGVSELWKSNRPQTLQTGLTGVKQSHRCKGIAQSLKLKAAKFARTYSAQFIRTNNHVINRPMLSINEAMGFVKEPAWVNLKKEMTW